MSFEAAFMKAGNLGRTLDLTDTEGRHYMIEPYMIYTSDRGRRSLLFYQLAGPPPEAPIGWKRPEAVLFQTATIREDRFTVRPEYDPFDKARYPVVAYSVATPDGRQRWADAPKPRDKGTLTNREPL